ncbi:NAC domain [Arabidopsis suecica]|uniref:NAC domain n=1 Tax=Arabidopsis suecica TaxID=45249 RepID=A0A8T2BSD6_ARASU|nr:NAC domain [Arabidopsis suecica]
MPVRNKRKERCSPEPQTQQPSGNPSSSSLAADNLPPPSMLAYLLPPGYQFVPSDQQLIFCYLDGYKNVFLSIPIHLVNIYDSNPEQLHISLSRLSEIY